ncbi:uncharacterized protein LOC115087836 isoform X3 [Rhinatrema bivittatum]|uniref:uncharacterized protein LOC115087836 isoform X3 n=1 Tax=Rhinatrema bivittatum TaxID=194408 RepID=UPI001129DC10|nr:uncharacterized protein LOC115087836 isoform X3 [Rhinatrema bivittatum]
MVVLWSSSMAMCYRDYCTHQFGCCMISVVVDLRTATLDILSHIVNGLLHVQNHLGSILGTFYALQPQRKELRKFLLKSLRLCQKRGLLESPLKCILPNKACDLFSYIDQSQLTSEFGGYFMYEHEKWVCFRKEMDGFSRQYTSVFKRLPSCLVRLEALGCEPFPSRQEELKGFSQQIQNSYTSLRRWLGIDDLQSKCESIVHKFQKREVDCYQAVSGTIMFNLAFVNVLNHRQRIRASMDKMEWLWQKACAKIQFSLKKLEYKQAAQEIIEFISTQAMRKLEAYEIQIASSISQAEVLRQEYMSAIYDPAMILLEHVADVIENLECLEGGNEVEDYIWQLWKLKERFSAAVEIPFQTLKSIHDYHYLFNKATHWYRLVLNQISFKNALWHEMDRQLSITGDVTHINPAWNEHVHSFVTNNPLPDPEEFVHLGQLSYLLSELQRLPGAQLSYRCLVLWQLLTCHEQVLPTDLQQAIYWQQSFLDFHSKPYSLTEDAKIVTSEPKAVRGIFIPQTLLQNCQNNCKSSVTSNRRHSSSSGQGHKTRNESERVEDASQRIGASMQNIDQLEKNISYWNISTGKSFSNLPVELRNLNQAYAKSNHKAQLNTHGQENIFNPVSIDKKIASKSKKLECGTNIATTLRIKGQRDTHIENCNVSATQSASLLNPWLSLPLEDLDQPYVTVMFESPLPQILHDKSSFVHSKDKLSQQISSVVDFSINKQVTTRSVEIQVSDTSLNIFAFRECAVQTDDSICYEPSDFQASKCELSPVKLALCSTFNEAERLQDINDSSKSIIWDSYDLHPSRLLESSKTNHIINEPEWLSDWDTKEQIHLCNIESLLNKAETVLQEEEHILKHEKEMEHFLEMEMLKSEKQEIAENIQNLDCVHQVMSPKELSEAGVIGIQDFHCSETEPEDYSFQFVSQSEKLGNKLGLSDTVNQTLSQRTVVLTGPPYSEFLKELKDLYHIEEKIWEENMKLEELRDMQQLENCQERNSLNQIKKQLLFLIQLQRERNEVEKLEYSFANEEAKQKLNLRKKLYEIPDLEMCHSAKQIAKTIVKSLSKFSAKSVNWPVSTTSSDLLSKKCNEKETCQLVNCSDTHSPITQQLQEKPIDAKNSVPVESSEVSSQKNLQDSRSVVGSETVFHSLTNPILETKAFLKKAILSHKTHALSKLTNLQCRECASEESIQSDTVNDMKRVKDNSAVISTKKKVEMLQSVQLCLNKNRIELNRICNPAEQRTRNRNGRATHKSLGKQDKMVGVSPLLKGQNLEMLNGAVKPSLPHITEIITPGINSRKSKQVCSEENVYASSNRLYNIAFCEEPSEDSLISPPRCPIGTTLHISAMKLSDYSFPIVLDIRSGLMKAGFANLDLPVTVFPTIIGLPKYEEAVSSNTENIYIGHEAQHIKSVLNIKNPVTHGIVTDWDDLEKIWHYTFYDQLHADPEQHPVMLTETAMNPESRAHMVQIMFEAFSVPFAYIAVQAVLALYSTGRTSGVVFDSGDDVSYSVPVYEGYSLPHAIQRLNLAGCDLTNYLQKLLQKNGCLFRAPTQEIAREMKEKCCYVAQDAETELPSEVHYNLPDGQSITLSTERFRAPEVLFKQELIGKDQDGVHESLCRSLLLTDVDLRKTFAENLVLSGGNTLLTGLPLRLQKEICSLVPVNLRDSVSVTSVPDQDFAVWNGGAALVSSPAFHTAWISKQEYDEFGPDIVYKRCF